MKFRYVTTPFNYLFIYSRGGLIPLPHAAEQDRARVRGTIRSLMRELYELLGVLGVDHGVWVEFGETVFCAIFGMLWVGRLAAALLGRRL